MKHSSSRDAGSMALRRSISFPRGTMVTKFPYLHHPSSIPELLERRPQHDNSLDREEACYAPYTRYHTTNGDLSGLVNHGPGWSPMTAPQPVRDASVASVTRRQELPVPGLETKTKAFLHMSKARRHRRVTLIIRSGFSPRGESLGFAPPL